MIDKIISGKLTEGKILSWIDMHCLDGNVLQIKLDLSNFDSGTIINMQNAKFILTPEGFLKEIENET